MKFPLVLILSLASITMNQIVASTVNQQITEIETNKFTITLEEDGSCTVTIEAQFDAQLGIWTVAQVSGSGTVTVTATAATCREAMNDVKDGLAALAEM